MTKIALALFGLTLSSLAHAVSVSYYLDQSNGANLPDGTNYLQVTISSTVAGTADFTVTPIYPFVQGTNYGLQAFGFNFSGANLNSITASDFILPSGWSANLPPPTGMGGFGKYDFVVKGSGSSRISPLSFTVTGLGGSSESETLSYFTTLSSGNAANGNEYFAAHLAGLVGPQTSAYFGGMAPVPEPSAWMLMMAGIGLVAYRARRRQIA